jgi:hypothetical protein
LIREVARLSSAGIRARAPRGLLFVTSRFEGIVLTAGIAATIPELQQAAFHYAT